MQIKIKPFVAGQLVFVPIAVQVPAGGKVKLVRKGQPSTKVIARQFGLFLGL